MNGLVRTQVLLEEQQRTTLYMLGAAQDISMGELIRKAVALYIKSNPPKISDRRALINKLAGSWAKSKNWQDIDPTAWQRQLRREKGI